MKNVEDGPPRRKHHRRYVFYRFYCAVVVIAWNVTGFAILARESDALRRLETILIPFVIPAIFMLLNLGAFRLPYSVFGPLQRSHPPSEVPEASYSATGGVIGLMTATPPFFSYSVYKAGLGISILGIGSCYLPYEDITRIKKGLWGCSIRHRNKEMRTPITAPRNVGLKVMEMCEGHARETSA